MKSVPQSVLDDIDRARAEGRILNEGIQPHAEDYADEAAFDADLVRRAKELGWDSFHPYYMQRSREGWPDRVFWRPAMGDRLSYFHAELKSMTGKLTPEQMQTIDSLRKAGQRVYVWQPCDWPQIEEVLK